MSKFQNKTAQVFFRILPREEIKWEYAKIKGTTIYFRNLQDLSNPKKGAPVFWKFRTNGVFLNTSQEEVYTKATRGVLERITDGQNGIIAAFGQTGTGKSFTIGGLQLGEEDFGIIPRVIIDLFKLKETIPKNIKMCIQISYVEFYKSVVADLLKLYPNYLDSHRCKDATKMKVKTEYDALKLIYIAEGRKLFADSERYQSHRCTSVVTFHVTLKNMDYTNPKYTYARLHIIDLAGVDTIGSPSSMIKQLPDIGSANTMKTILEQFILCLQENVPIHIRTKGRSIPFLYYLGDDLKPESMLRFVGHLRISKEDLTITMSMLRFGQLVREIKSKNKTSIFKEVAGEHPEKVEMDVDDLRLQIKILQRQLDQIEREKVLNSVLLNQNLCQTMNQDRIDHIQRTVECYLNNQISEIDFLNVTEASMVFKIFKEICQKYEKKILLSQQAAIGQTQSDTSRRRSSRATASMSSIKVTKQMSKRISKGSKESMVTAHLVNKPLKTESVQSVGSQRLKGGKKSSTGSTQGLNKKKSKSSSINLKRSSVRKSNTSTSMGDKKDSRTVVSIVPLIPEIIPGYEEAWNTFINDKESSYKRILEEYRANELSTRDSYKNYIAQFKKLQNCKEIFETRTNENFEYQMVKKFNASKAAKSEEEDRSSSVIADNEDQGNLYENNLKSAQLDLLEQQELVLTCQTQLKVYLNNRKEIKKQLNEDFNNYCKDNFNIPVVATGEEILMVETTPIVFEEPPEEIVEIKEFKSTRIATLKHIMEKELAKTKKLRESKAQQWKNYLTNRCCFKCD